MLKQEFRFIPRLDCRVRNQDYGYRRLPRRNITMFTLILHLIKLILRPVIDIRPRRYFTTRENVYITPAQYDTLFKRLKRKMHSSFNKFN